MDFREIDLSKRGQITLPERFAIAEALHAMIIDEVAAATRWKLGQAVFHGGTSLKLAWESQRFSEDLDFMVSEQLLESLHSEAKRVIDRIRLRTAAMHPGSQLELIVKRGRPGPDRVDVWDVKWLHANRIGKILVKMECYAVSPEKLSEYATRMTVPVIGQRGGIRITTPVPVAEMISLWADKVKAIATRPAFKWRDAYDLAFIVSRLERTPDFPDHEKMTAALVLCASIYGKSPQDVIDGLEKRLETGEFDDTESFRQNMANWFAPETYASLADRGMFDQMLRTAKQEVETGIELLKSLNEQATPKP